ncbi:Glucokinase [Spironucleus salmonicida]|uniref:Glucokinase n=1 Tax=Spironucleus salmonicida TaxID=348837 RepID=V6LTI1_9EUKA|nr:Glucokinase [Spironucleus salmonicida]|eukprot:EST47890.1 Glucokinase [Spironucleus salmonicida]
MKIIVDLGSTYTKIAIFSEGRLIEQLSMRTQNDKFTQIIDKVQKLNYSQIVIAIAGPHDDKNLYFTIEKCQIQYSKQHLQSLFKGEVYFLNDMESVGYSIKCNNAIFIGIGTGIGVCYKVNNTVYASECGHIRVDLDQDLNEFLCRKFKISVISYDRIISSQGIISLCEFYSKNNLTAKQIFKTRPQIVQKYFLFVEQYILQIRKMFNIQSIFLTGGVVSKNYQQFKQFSNQFSDVSILNQQQAFYGCLNFIELVENK